MLSLNKHLLSAIFIFLIPFYSIAKTGDISIDGKIRKTNSGNVFILSKEYFDNMKKSQIKTTTSWTKKDHRVNFEGVKVKDILNEVGAFGSTLRMHALNDYWVDIPVSDVDKYDIILANKMDGKNLKVRDFGPYFVIYPVDKNPDELNKPIYLSRFIWQVDKITVI